MPVSNAEVAAVFSEIADLLEIENANPFRVRAYRNAARSVADMAADVRSLADNPQALDALPGIGPDLAAKIADIVHTGTCAQLERLRQRLPAGIGALLKVPGLGPRRVQVLHQRLGIGALEQLRSAALQRHIQRLPGFGPRSEQRILQATNTLLQQDVRHLRSAVEGVARALLQGLAGLPGVHRTLAAGSLRRCQETVGDLDLLVTCDKPRVAMDYLCTAPQVQRVLERGVTRSSVLLQQGLQVDLRAVAPASYGAAALYFTGSRAHNIALRQLARDQGMRLNEYGLFRGRQRVHADSEEAVLAALGLPYIEPELRENRGEIAAAQGHSLPKLLQRADLLGDLHCHTQDSDGRDTLERMAAAAQAQGLQYLAITDHCAHLAPLHGLDAGGLARQMDRIDALNARLGGLVLLKGVEVDILEDGKLALPDSVLRRLDLVVGAVHSHFDLSRSRQTAWLLRAMDQACFSVLAHPLSRLIHSRPPIALDFEQLLRQARTRGCFLELNAQPERLDLDDIHCRMAKNEGVLVCINTDAHSATQFENLRLGLGQARRGWLQSAEVLNTRSLQQLRPLLRATMQKAA